MTQITEAEATALIGLSNKGAQAIWESSCKLELPKGHGPLVAYFAGKLLIKNIERDFINQFGQEAYIAFDLFTNQIIENNTYQEKV